MTNRVFSVCSAVLLGACGGSESHDKQSAEQQSADLPNRIASTVVLGDELLWQLGSEIRSTTVAVSQLADDQRYSPVAKIWPSSVVRLGMNPEMLLAISPDLALVSSFSQPEYRAAIEPHLQLLEFTNFTGFVGYLENLDKLGQTLGVQERAEKLKQDFLAEQQRIEGLRGPPSQWPRCLSWAYGHVPGLQTTFHAAVVTAGCRNVPAEEKLTGHKRVDTEQIVEWNPDFIVIGCADANRCERTIQDFGKRPGFSYLHAFRSNQVIAVESAYLSTTGSGMLILAQKIQSAIRSASRNSPID